METETAVYELKPFALVLAAVIAIEICAASLFADPLAAAAIARTLDAAVMMAAAFFLRKSADLPGISPAAVWPGAVRGILWSAGFGCAAAAAGAVLYAAGFDPLAMIRVDLPGSPARLLLFVAVGGIVSPFAEELIFRGAVFGVLRRYGALAAVAGSSIVFAAAHHGTGLPVTQTVGGVVFALSYEIEKNLLVPVAIHISGNLALFALGSL
ncbi:MAG: CPBP family intramembrane glutamic endopeptidase [Thermodesulfobacteriota bacterium]